MNENNATITKLHKYTLLFGCIMSSLMFSGCNKKNDSIESTPPQIEIAIENTLDSNTPLDETTPPILDKAEVTDEISDSSDEIVNNNLNNPPSVQVFPNPFHFYDVFRNDYEIELDENVNPNPYLPSMYSYINTDNNGEILSDVEITDDTDIFIPGSEATGYTGIIKYEDDTYTSRFGIDVSKFQGNIDWNRVHDAGVTFAFIRIGFRGYGSSGSLSEDAKYRQNIEGAQAAGIDVGVYFYAQAINEDEAIEEAEFVKSLLSGYSLQLPVVYDPEHVLNDTARTDNVSGEQFTKNTIAFCNNIREAGYTPMTYANMLWEGYELDMSQLKDIPIWYADYELKPQSPYGFSIWQYSQAGHISGINGTVDLDIMYVPK